jgi:cephalosporin-C deacetylase-like acetyl esterase
MLRRRIPYLLAVWSAWAWPGAPAAVAKVELAQAEDRSVSVVTSVYSAKIDGQGNLKELTVKGGLALRHRFGTPNASPPPAPAVQLAGRTVTVRSGKARLAYTFAEDRIKVSTQGYDFECQPDESVKAVLVPGGKGGAYTRQAVYPGSSALVLGNQRTVAFSIPFHVLWQRLVPTGYCDGSIKPGTPLTFEFMLGAPVAPEQLLSTIEITPVGAGYGRLNEGGNQGYGMVHFPEPRQVVFETTQENLSREKFDVEYRLVVLDHYVAGKEVARQARRQALAGGAQARTRWQLPALPPGFYYLTVSAWVRGSERTASRQTFAVDLSAYARPLTRPADFHEFWERQDRRLKQVPAEPALKLVSAGDNPDRTYELTLNMPGGGKLRGLLYVPARPGPGPAVLGSLVAKELDGLFGQARAPGFRLKAPVFNLGGDRVVLWLALPDDATFGRWNSAEDNNLLQCVLCYLRAADYLAGRPEVAPGRIKTVGASRSGPLVFITAARRPALIGGVQAHVPTSAGLSWEDKPYTGWGGFLSREAEDPAAVRLRTRLAAYVDPVNHAPDVRAPLILAYGVDDPLSPPQGVEAMYHHAASRWKRISRDGGGHQFSPGFQRLQQELDALLRPGRAGKR